jgi:uncharacterized protein with GYD domain
MAHFVMLGRWTAEGVKDFDDTVERSEQADTLLGTMGGRLVGIWWTLGKQDFVAVIQAPDDETAMAFVLKLGAQGNIETTTMRAFDAAEMKAVLAKAGG